MTFDGGSAEPLGASSPVSLAVRDEAVGLSGVEGLSASGLLARGHARCWGLELAQGLGQCAGEESAVDPEHSHVGAGPHDTLGLVQVHGQSEVAVSQGPGQAVSLRCGVSAVEEDFREGRKRVDDVQAGRDAVADSGAECESRRDLRDWAGTDCWRVGGEVGLVAEEVLCGATVGGGAVSPAGVPVEGVDLPSVRVQLRFVGRGEALYVGAVDRDGSWSLKLRRQARLDEQSGDVVQIDRFERAADGAGQHLAGGWLEVEFMVVVDEHSDFHDAADGVPSGVNTLVLDLKVPGDAKA